MRPDLLTIYNIGPFQGSHTIDFTELGDIFLIFGKTGAGKTTIFDALSYAFYGEVPGGRNGITKHMRSHFAADDDDSIVELEFTLSGQQYRVKRSLPRESIGVRSGKLVQKPEEVSFEKKTLLGWENRTSTKKTDTDTEIITLIGLSADEFSRIVLLPQGEFSRFLKRNSNDRKEVLAKLFPVSQYTNIIDTVRARTREATQKLKETENNVLSLHNDSQGLLTDKDIETLKIKIDENSIKQKTLRNEISEYTTLLEKSRSTAQKKQSLKNLNEEYSLLITQSEHITNLKASILKARKARPLKTQIEVLDSLKRTEHEQKEELKIVIQDYIRSEENLTTLQNTAEEIKTHIVNKEKLLLKKEQLRIAVDISENLDLETTKRNETRKQATHVKKEIAAHRADSDNFVAALDNLQNDMGDSDALADAHQKARDILEQSKTVHGLASDFEKEQKAVLIHRKTIETTHVEIKTNQTDIDITKEERELLQTEIENEHTQDLAGNLAKTLVPGMACPVCGSKEHPFPAQERQAQHSLTERRESLERRILQLGKKQTDLEKELTTREANLKNAQERLQSLAAKSPNKGDVPNPIQAEQNLQDAIRATQAAADTLSSSRTAWREAENIRKKKTVCDAAIVERTSYLTQIEKEEATADSAVKAALIRYKEAGLAPDTDAEEALEICISDIFTLDAKISVHASRLDEEKNRKSVLEGRKHSLEAALLHKEKEIETANLAWEQACHNSGFSGKEAILAAVLSENEELQRDKECSTWNESCSTIKARITDIESEASTWTEAEPDSILALITEAETKLHEVDAHLSVHIGELSNLNALLSRKKALEAQRAERSLEAGRLQSLCDDLTGNNPAHISFDAWILGIYLEEITAYANTRLERMSEGRYSIQLNDSYRKGNSLSGLELEIFDSWTGKPRPSGTLSGGETFMTSISLALGLADSIQARAGGIQLDAVFIDEGFGSLDESSLERSISILDEIRGSRMVGIISHVGELRNRIPNRIEIIKTGTGSSIKKEMCNG